MFKVLLTVCLILLLATESTAKVTKFTKSPYKDKLLKLHLALDQTSQSRNLNGSALSGGDPSPVIFWHGMGDTAYGSINIERLALQAHFPGMRVYSIQMGSNAFEDELAGYFANVNEQVDQACEEIIKTDYIRAQGTLNLIGFSQGGQFARALVQRCPFKANGIKVNSFISLGGQHQGVYGLPNCPSQTYLCDHIRHLLTHGAYDKMVQEHVVQAQYWHDPMHEQDYRERNLFLSDLNNELSINETYKSSLIDLNHMVLVAFLQDEMVVPRESSQFGFFASGQTEKIVGLRESQLYIEDRLGLRQLDQSGRLHLISIPGKHLQYKTSWFLKQIASVYLVD